MDDGDAAPKGGFERLIRLLGLAGGGALVFMVLLTAVDVVLRKLWNAPIFGALDIHRMTLVTVVFLAIPYCGWVRGHVAVDLLGGVLGRKGQRITDTLVNLLGALVMAVIAWRAVLAAITAAERGARTDLMQIAHWPFYCVIALGAGLYAAIQIIHAVQAATGRLPSGETAS